MRPVLRLALAALIVMLMSACHQPTSYEHFIPAEHSGGLAFDDNIYRFEVDMSDSTAFYDIYFYTRAENTGLTQVRGDLGQMQVDVTWLSPVDAQSDSTFTAGQPMLSETVYMPLGDDRGAKALYRSGVRPDPCGIWTIEVKSIAAPKGLRGMGIICKRHYGTR